MKKTQKLLVKIENISIQTTFGALDKNLLPLAMTLIEDTAKSQKTNDLILPTNGVVDGLCVTIGWVGSAPKCVSEPKEIFGIETNAFLKKQY